MKKFVDKIEELIDLKRNQRKKAFC
jgi:hypothetical protein